MERKLFYLSIGIATLFQPCSSRHRRLLLIKIEVAHERFNFAPHRGFLSRAIPRDLPRNLRVLPSPSFGRQPAIFAFTWVFICKGCYYAMRKPSAGTLPSDSGGKPRKDEAMVNFISGIEQFASMASFAMCPGLQEAQFFGELLNKACSGSAGSFLTQLLSDVESGKIASGDAAQLIQSLDMKGQGLPQILQSVASGELKPDDAAQLLQALGGGSQASGGIHRTHGGHFGQFLHQLLTDMENGKIKPEDAAKLIGALMQGQQAAA